MFVTKYDRYAQYHPAEGGIYLHGWERLESEEFNSERSVKDFLLKMFYEELGYYGIGIEEVETAKREWGIRYSVETEEVSITLVLKDDEELVSDYHTDDDGFEDENYESWIRVEENSPYVDRFCYEYIPESKEGIHERPAYYC